MESSILKAKIDNKKMYLLRFIFEGHGHLAWLSSPEEGIVLIRTSKDTETIVKKIVEMLKDKIGFQGWI